MRNRGLGQSVPELTFQGDEETDEGSDIIVREAGGDVSSALDVIMMAPEIGMTPSDIDPSLFVEELPADHGIANGGDPIIPEPAPMEVGGGALEDVTEFWEENKKAILIGGGALAAIGLWFKFRK